MPFAPKIRKEIIEALEEHIIPALWRRQVALGYVAPPLVFPVGMEKNLLSSRLPRSSSLTGFPVQTSWPGAHLHCTQHPYLSFIYEGVADERTLVTETQDKTDKGLYAIRWQAPGLLFFPPGTPRNEGNHKSFREGSGPPSSTIKILQLAILDDILVHIHHEAPAQVQVEASHSLQIRDASLLALTALFAEELRSAPTTHQETAQAALLTCMLRLRNFLSSHPPRLANTSHPPIIESLSPAHGQDFYRKAVHFIQTHLHEPLSLPMIAREAELSPAHLSRLFRRFSGVPVMRYVRQQRINAAKEILKEGPENIKEIALLLNFKRPAAFCNAFRHETGMTPLQFRRKAQKCTNITKTGK